MVLNDIFRLQGVVYDNNGLFVDLHHYKGLRVDDLDRVVTLLDISDGHGLIFRIKEADATDTDLRYFR